MTLEDLADIPLGTTDNTTLTGGTFERVTGKPYSPTEAEINAWIDTADLSLLEKLVLKAEEDYPDAITGPNASDTAARIYDRARNRLDGGVSQRPGGDLNGAEITEPTLRNDVIALSNAPNPFSSSTTISFDLNAPTRVHAQIYDAMGRHVAQLLNTDLDAGPQSVRWDVAGTLPSGVYLIKLRIGVEVHTRLVTLMR